MIISALIITAYSYLYRKGGDGFKPARRVGLPLLTSAIYWLTHVNFWWLSFPIGIFAFWVCPITFLGNDIIAKKPFEKKVFGFEIFIPTRLVTVINWAWIPVLGVLIGLMTLNLTLALVYSLFFTVIVVLSNWKKTANIFTWDRVELALGALLGYLVMMY